MSGPERHEFALAEEPWIAGDGTRWLYFAQFGEWHGWVPGEDGLFVYPLVEFRAVYPDAPNWDGTG